MHCSTKPIPAQYIKGHAVQVNTSCWTFPFHPQTQCWMVTQLLDSMLILLLLIGLWSFLWIPYLCSETMPSRFSCSAPKNTPMNLNLEWLQKEQSFTELDQDNKIWEVELHIKCMFQISLPSDIGSGPQGRKGKNQFIECKVGRDFCLPKVIR